MKLTPEILSTVRSVLMFVAGLLVTFGYIGQDEINPLIDNLMIAVTALGALGVMAWGIWQKRVQKKEVAVAKITPATPAAIAEAKEVLKPTEVARAMSSDLAPATVTGTGKVV